MATYVFSGRVLPERAQVTLPTMRFSGIALRPADVGFMIDEISVGIELSQISITVTISQTTGDGLSPLQLFTLKNGMESFVRSQLDAVGYLVGAGYDVDISSVVDHHGIQTVLGVGIPELQETQNERPLPPADLFRLVATCVPLRLALADLRQAIRSPDYTSFYCYRAIESVMQGFTTEQDLDKGRAWQRLKQSLQIDETWLKVPKGYADQQRHGRLPYVSSEERILALQHAWKVVDRYCVYLQRGGTPLSDTEFPLLEDS